MGLPGPIGYRGESGPVGPVGRQGIPVNTVLIIVFPFSCVINRLSVASFFAPP